MNKAQAQGSQRDFKVAVLGAGPRGSRWADEIAANPRTTLTGVVDIDLHAAARFAATHNVSKKNVAESVTALLERDHYDFCINTTSPNAHVDTTLSALVAQLPVITEKPLATTMEGARRIVREANLSGLMVMTSQNRRYDRNLRKFKTVLEHLGTVEALSCVFRRSPRFNSYQEQMDHPLLVDMAIHHFDVARFILDTDPAEVFCVASNPSWSWFKNNASALAAFTMVNGAKFNYDGSWCNDGLLTSWNAEWRASGPRGSATWDGETAFSCELDGQIFDTSTVIIDAKEEQVAAALGEFVQYMDTGRTPMGACQDNIYSLAMAMGAVSSSDQRRLVDLQNL
ncbi:Gfo/Idh/MocA family protein [Clavibacter californiensis]|uniref:Gfo/Idh/MocA family oxidoreductase n=1 Tax=Clavibacter californiensis TaxID=1401995 RepID=A0ABX9NAY3_9MICO|nr:Gfo/Idh/MocA family oxidoreductase [Clavibacter californiensis]RII94869.1 gfo/Idh/MocA family oxidoreductase [Clavibacter californiensis]UKF81698.1 Gfo/Idh/MocA family oxidoreductase [Clavibacter californiensis]